MILFTILLIVLAVVATIVLTVIGLIGGAALALFGDLFVFALIVYLVIKLIKLFKRRK